MRKVVRLCHLQRANSYFLARLLLDTRLLLRQRKKLFRVLERPAKRLVREACKFHFHRRRRVFMGNHSGRRTYVERMRFGIDYSWLAATPAKESIYRNTLLITLNVKRISQRCRRRLHFASCFGLQECFHLEKVARQELGLNLLSLSIFCNLRGRFKSLPNVALLAKILLLACRCSRDPF